MIDRLTHISLLVKDYDEAFQWYTQKLGLELRDDPGEYAPGYRWLTVGVKGQNDLEVVLYKPDSEKEKEFVPLVGKTPGFVFRTDNCRTEVEQLRAKGVKIKGEPEVVPWGVQAIFEDLYGNTHVLVEPPQESN